MVRSKISRFCLSFRFTVFVKCTYIFAQMMLAVFLPSSISFRSFIHSFGYSMDVHFHLFALRISTILLPLFLCLDTSFFFVPPLHFTTLHFQCFFYVFRLSKVWSTSAFIRSKNICSKSRSQQLKHRIIGDVIITAIIDHTKNYSDFFSLRFKRFNCKPLDNLGLCIYV